MDEFGKIRKGIPDIKLPKLNNGVSQLFIWLFCFSFSGHAIVVRHDVPDESYHAKSTDFPPLATLYSVGVHGTLIDPEWVVTAAHAVFCLKPKQNIRVGEEIVSVANRYSHPDYILGEEHDLALIKLENPVTSVKPATLFRDKTEKDIITWFIGAGGTGTGDDGETISYSDNKGKLRKAHNKIIDVTDTDLVYKFEKGDKGLPLEGVSGNGDSGGPAFVKGDYGYTLLGISSRIDSWFYDVGEYGVTELYTRVSSYTDWIEKVITAENESSRMDMSTQDPFLQPGMQARDMGELCSSIEVQ
ncbi:S1 family peptidase [Alteromonas sp. ASW11-130]|uniref:S1 family peptidase n=1 Tax=Alteromonas sp. ASW11-130 TaxID=3015775 RepID=UPI002242831A|nr:trypsin-like serine protease [Alteromonas sp. ASW11-130]MCW8092602.1 trypsin-like serine protease [Alteromonas sp. ASW11-130]